MTNQDKIKILKTYLQNDRELKLIQERLEELRDRFIHPKAATMSDMPRGGSNQKDVMCKNIIMLEKIQKTIAKKSNELLKEQSKIQKAINDINDSICREVITVRYLQGKSWEEVCVDMRYSWSQIHRLHVQALSKIKLRGGK